MNAKETLGTALWEIPLDQIGWALLTAVICLIAVKLVMRFVVRAIERLPIARTLSRFLLSAAKLVLYFVAGMIVADKLGVPVASLVAVLGVAGLAFSLAIQDSLTNLFSGMTILIGKPFVVGDFVEVGGVSGTVDSIGLNYTRLMMADNKLIFVPNKEVSSGKIINYTGQLSRRVEIKVSAPYDVPAQRVKEALLSAANQVSLLYPDPAPFAGMNAYGQSGIEYVLRVWSSTKDYWDAYYQLMERVKEAFDAGGIDIPMTCVDVRLAQSPKEA